MTPDPLPGAVGLSHLAVYDSTAPDGEHGGSPHMHLSCTEAYVVQAGRGRIQTLGADGAPSRWPRQVGGLANFLGSRVLISPVHCPCP